MERLSHVSISLCSSCVSFISRNMKSICLKQKGVYFSTNTQFMNNAMSRSRESLLSVNGSQIKQQPRRQVEELSLNLKNNDLLGARQYSLTSDQVFFKKLSNSLLRKTNSSRYQTCFNAKLTVPLLRFNIHVNSALFYSTSASTPDPQIPPPPRKASFSPLNLISWKTVLLFACVGVVITVAVQLLKTQKELERKKARNRTIGKAKLGGAWTLTDHYGNRRSSAEFLGQWLLIYFGFTHCPDVCPEELEKIVGVITKTDANEKLPKIQPLIITVDPERDTPQALKEYCSEFSPRLLGFTGSTEEIQQATHAYRVYFSAGPKDDDNDYIVDHSIISYLVDPEGQFVEYFGQNKTVDDIYNSIQFHIAMFNKK